MSSGGTGGAAWRFCAKCGLETYGDDQSCSHCGAALDPAATPSTESVPTPWEPRYYAPKRGTAKCPIYVRQAESWVSVSPEGRRTRTSGEIPRAVVEECLEIDRQQAEAEIARRDQMFVGSITQSALQGEGWLDKIILGLSGLPVAAVYYFAIAWFGVAWPARPPDVTMIILVVCVAILPAALASSLLLASRAGEDVWQVGAVVGAVVGVVAAVVAIVLSNEYDYRFFRMLMFQPYDNRYFLFLTVIGWLPGAIGGGIAQLIVGPLRPGRLGAQARRLKPGHLAAAIGALGVVLAVASGLRFY